MATARKSAIKTAVDASCRKVPRSQKVATKTCGLLFNGEVTDLAKLTIPRLRAVVNEDTSASTVAVATTVHYLGNETSPAEASCKKALQDVFAEKQDKVECDATFPTKEGLLCTLDRAAAAVDTCSRCINTDTVEEGVEQLELDEGQQREESVVDGDLVGANSGGIGAQIESSSPSNRGAGMLNNSVAPKKHCGSRRQGRKLPGTDEDDAKDASFELPGGAGSLRVPLACHTAINKRRALAQSQVLLLSCSLSLVGARFQFGSTISAWCLLVVCHSIGSPASQPCWRAVSSACVVAAMPLVTYEKQWTNADGMGVCDEFV